MPRVDIPATNKTPAVRFDPEAGILEMTGCSIHENADRFFRPLLEQIETYAKRPAKRTVLRFSMQYFNSSSAKYILDLLKLLDEAHASGAGTVILEWHHAQDDLDMEEAGQDYKALLEMPVKLIPD